MAPSLMIEFRQIPTQTVVLVQHVTKAERTTQAQAEVIFKNFQDHKFAKVRFGMFWEERTVYLICQEF